MTSPDSTPNPPPLIRPDFTLKIIHDAIPAHCFKRSLTRSLAHLTLNLFICLLLFYLASHINLTTNFALILWPIYWLVQGIYFLGIWVLAHECGHRAFSDYAAIDHTIGFLLHSFLLVPYQSWRIGHAHHHRHGGHCEEDQVFVPPPRSAVQSVIVEILEESPVYNAVMAILMLTFGLMPCYLLANLSGPEKFKKGSANSFNPSSVMFLPKQRNDILLADFGVFTVLLLLCLVGLMFGVKTILFYYGIPYLLCNCWVAIITFLHHTDTFVPHFRDPEWTWLRGALCTVDRSYGSWLNHAFHHIADTHVCHHLFPSLPFYNSVEATRAISPILGHYHLRDDTPILKALVRSFSTCKFVEDDQNIVFYKRNLSKKFQN